MKYRYKEKFERDAGYRFFRNGRSILLQSPSTGRRFTDEQIKSYTKILNDHLYGVLGRKSQTGAVQKLLSSQDFAPPPEAPLYKYVSDQTWHYIQRGSFQLGSAAYYRTTENQGIR